MVVFAGSAWAAPTINFIEDPNSETAVVKITTSDLPLAGLDPLPSFNPIDTIEGLEYARVVFFLTGPPIITSQVITMMAEADGSASAWIKLEYGGSILNPNVLNAYIATFWSDGASDFPTNLTPTPATSDVFSGVVTEDGTLQQVIRISSHTAGQLVINAQSDFTEQPPGVPIPGSLLLMGSGLFGLVGIGIRRKSTY